MKLVEHLSLKSFFVLMIFKRFYSVKIGLIFDGSQLSFVTFYRKIISVCLSGSKKLLISTWKPTNFHNHHHTIADHWSFSIRKGESMRSAWQRCKMITSKQHTCFCKARTSITKQNVVVIHTSLQKQHPFSLCVGGDSLSEVLLHCTFHKLQILSCFWNKGSGN